MTGALRVRSGLAITRKCTVNQFRVDLIKRVTIEAEPCQYSRSEGFKQDIGIADQLVQCLQLWGAFQVQPANTFATVEMTINRRYFVCIDVHEKLHRIATRGFDLYHLGAEVGKLAGCKRPWDILRHIDDADIFQQAI